MVAADSVRSEERERVPALVFEDAFVADGVDGDVGAGVDAEDRAVTGAGEGSPEDVVRGGGQVVGSVLDAVPRLQGAVPVDAWNGLE